MADDAKQDLELNFEQALNDTLYNSFDKGYYIGMMSGTSLDGLDAVICQFDDIENSTDNDGHNIIVATHSCDFPIQLRQVLLALCQPNASDKLSELAIDGLTDVDYPQSELEWFGWASREYGEFTSQVVNELLEKSGIAADSILAMGCHGQTVRHRPNLGFSLQLVDPNIIAERTGISVVSDFRRRDMAVGGQGAPLAPAFHLAQFGSGSEGDDTTHRIIVNLGGIANITVLPANQTSQVVGYDTGPANILLDAWYQFNVEHHDLLNQYSSYLPLYDKDGQWAKTGKVNQSLLDELLTHPYFDEPTPKSTGREAFHIEWLNEQIAHVKTQTQQDISSEDVQATLTALTVQTLSDAINAEVQRLNLTPDSSANEHPNEHIGDVIICGGGAYNSYLLQQLAKALPNWHVVTSEHFGIAPTWVEAMAFAWLARQTIMGEVGNLPAVTGASKGVVLGQVCFA